MPSQEARRRRLGQLVQQARRARGETQDQLAARAGGMSTVTLRAVENGASVKPLTYSRIERALGWRPGSIELYLAGGSEPQPANLERLIDWALDLSYPPTIKLLIIKALRHGGDPIDAVINIDAPGDDKVQAIEALRHAPQPPDPPSSSVHAAG